MLTSVYTTSSVYCTPACHSSLGLSLVHGIYFFPFSCLVLFSFWLLQDAHGHGHACACAEDEGEHGPGVRIEIVRGRVVYLEGSRDGLCPSEVVTSRLFGPSVALHWLAPWTLEEA